MFWQGKSGCTVLALTDRAVGGDVAQLLAFKRQTDRYLPI